MIDSYKVYESYGGGITKRFLNRCDALRYAEKTNAFKVIALDGTVLKEPFLGMDLRSIPLDEYDERVGDAIWRREPTEEEIDRESERKIYDRSDI